MADYQSLVERKLSPVGVVGADVVYRCPECEGEDSSGHLYVNYDKNYWHCFKCDIGGKQIESLLNILNIDVSYDYEKLYREVDTRLDDIISSKKSKKPKEQVAYSNDLKLLKEYYDCHTMPLTPQALSYLQSRGLSLDIINKLEMREGINRSGEKLILRGKECIGRDYSGRIMVPSRRKDGLISFYLGRDYIGNKKAKYLNAPKEYATASEDVWNLDMVDSDSVIICEGVFTAIAASPLKLNSVATYGKSIASRSSSEGNKQATSQGEKLLAKKFKNYYVVYDADAHSEAVKTCQYLYDRGANVYLVTIDPLKYGAKADVADIGYSEFINLLSKAIKYTGGLSIL